METTNPAKWTILRSNLSSPIPSSSAIACLYYGDFTAPREISEVSGIHCIPNTIGKAQHGPGLLYLNSIVQTKILLCLTLALGTLWSPFRNQ